MTPTTLPTMEQEVNKCDFLQVKFNVVIDNEWDVF